MNNTDKSTQQIKEVFMNKTHVKPERATWLSPYMTVRDVDAAVLLYQNAFGFELLDKAPGDDGTTWHAEMRYQDQLIMMGKEGAWGGETKTPISSGVECPICLYLYTENVDDFHKKAIAAGAISLQAPDNMFWGDRMCRLKDEDGYIWSFATYQGE